MLGWPAPGVAGAAVDAVTVLQLVLGVSTASRPPPCSARCTTSCAVPAALTHVRTWGAVAVLPGWSAAQLAAEAGEHDGESFVEFGGAVVGGQDGGEGAQPGELGDG